MADHRDYLDEQYRLAAPLRSAVNLSDLSVQ